MKLPQIVLGTLLMASLSAAAQRTQRLEDKRAVKTSHEKVEKKENKSTAKKTTKKQTSTATFTKTVNQDYCPPCGMG